MPAKTQVAEASEKLRKEIESPDDLMHALAVLRDLAKNQLERADAHARSESPTWTEICRDIDHAIQLAQGARFIAM